MLMIFLLSQRGPDHQQEWMTLTSLDLMLLFRPMRNNLENPYCWLEGLLTNHLSWTLTSLNGLPPRIGTSFYPTLMMHTRIWWKISMLIPLSRERSSNAGLEERFSRWLLFIWQKSYTSTSRCLLIYRYMMIWIQMSIYFGLLLEETWNSHHLGTPLVFPHFLWN